eukprot:5881311-Pyramimonas_sp.AAC.1
MSEAPERELKKIFHGLFPFESLQEKIGARLRYWNVHITPDQISVAILSLCMLGHKYPCFIGLSILRCMCNAMNISRRYRQACKGCRFGCSGADDILHYFSCLMLLL